MPETSNELSERELEILRLVATGASNKEIARQLFISTNTVKVHLRNIYAKIGAASRTEAAMYAVNNGLVPSGVNIPQVELAEDDRSEAGGFADSPVEEPEHPGRGVKIAWWIGLGLLVVILLVVMRLFPAPGEMPAANMSAAPTEAPRWQVLSPMSAGRSSLAAAVYENYIYTIGGEAAQGITGLVERYDPVADTWEPMEDKPIPVSEIGGAVLGGKIYIPGGRLPAGSQTQVLEIYDPIHNTWQVGASLPFPISGYALAVFEGKLYLFGGWQGSQPTGATLEYDPGQDSWTELAAMPVARALAGAALVGRKIYVVGGYDGEQALKTNLAFQPDLITSNSGPWSQATDLPEGVYAMGATSLADIIYLVGGASDASRQFSVMAFSPQAENWQAFEVSATPVGSQLSLVNLGSYLYALGGQIGGVPSKLNLAYRAIYTVSIPVIIKE